jgi:hypothetical protein
MKKKTNGKPLSDFISGDLQGVEIPFSYEQLKSYCLKYPMQRHNIELPLMFSINMQINLNGLDESEVMEMIKHEVHIMQSNINFYIEKLLKEKQNEH